MTPDITDLIEMIELLTGQLGLAAKYCEHPDVVAMPFALNSQVVANKARLLQSKAIELLQKT